MINYVIKFQKEIYNVIILMMFLYLDNKMRLKSKLIILMLLEKNNKIKTILSKYEILIRD